MTINFPSPPVPLNQTITDPATNATWRWDGAKWVPAASGGIFATEDWVHQQLNPLGVARQNRNRLINGDFARDQYAGGAVQIINTAGTFVCDRWIAGVTQPGRLATQIFSSEMSAAIPGGLNGYGAFQGVVTGALAAGDTFNLSQRIETLNLLDIRWGTVNAMPLTLSFWASTGLAGVYSGAIVNGNATRSYPFTFTLPAGVWQYFTITIPGDQTGAWPTDVDPIMQLRFDLGSGANWRGPTDSWQSANLVGANGAAGVVGAQNALLNLSNVQLELGDRATPWDFKNVSQNYAELWRYFYRGPAMMPFNWYANAAGQSLYAVFSAPVIMRVVPTISAYWSNLTNCTIAIQGMALTDGRTIFGMVTSAGAGPCVASWSINTLDAEL